MALIALDDVTARFPKVADLGSSTNVTSAFIVPAINELDSKLASAYVVPSSSNNLTAQDLAIDLTYLRIQRTKNSDLAKVLQEDFDVRISRLITGKDQMIMSDGSVAQASQGMGDVWSNTKGYTPVFGMGPITHMHVDSSQVYDEAVARGETI